MREKIKIRKYLSEDAQIIAAIYYDTIHNVNIADYTAEHINAWAPYSSVKNYSGWAEKLAKSEPFVAVIDKTIVGFAEFEANGHIDCFYVHHEFQGQNIGTKLINTIENEAKTNNINRIYSEVSITAKPFFTSKGFIVVKEQIVKMRGYELTNFIMEKPLK